MDYNRMIIKKITNVMSYTKKDFLPDFQSNVSRTNEDGIYLNVWAKRSDLLRAEFDSIDGVDVISVNRKIFQFELVWDEVNSVLYVMMNKDTMNVARRRYLKKGIRTHYLYSFLKLNAAYNKIVQLELLDDKVEEQRSIDCQEMLHDIVDKVNKVLVVAYSYEDSVIIKGNVHLFDSSFVELESVDVSQYILDGQISDADNVLNDGQSKNHASEQTGDKPMVKLKKL